MSSPPPRLLPQLYLELDLTDNWTSSGLDRGQGLNHALADVGQLFKLLTNNLDSLSQEQIISDYETEMRTRGGEEVRLSQMNTFMLHDWDKVQQSPLIKKGMARGGS